MAGRRRRDRLLLRTILAGISIRDSQSEERAHALHALVLGSVKEFGVAVLKSDFSRH